jgi:hypothetical protein
MQAERRTPLKSSRANSARRLFILISTLTFTLDLATKNWAERFLQGRDSIKVIGEFLQLTYATNPGAAFSLFEDATLLLSALKLAVVGFIIFFIRQVTNKYWACSLAESSATSMTARFGRQEFGGVRLSIGSNYLIGRFSISPIAP